MDIYIDGGSRGNPGPSAIGSVFYNENGDVIKEYSEFIGKATNNEAEYQALIFSLKKTKALFGKVKAKQMFLLIHSDSELLISQQIGKYKVKEENLQKLFIEVWNLRQNFAKVDFVLISREKNKYADRLVNQALDSEEKAKTLF